MFSKSRTLLPGCCLSSRTRNGGLQSLLQVVQKWITKPREWNIYPMGRRRKPSRIDDVGYFAIRLFSSSISSASLRIRASNNPCVFQLLQLLFGYAKLAAVNFFIVRAHFGA
jgi:hypothetical protein